MNQTSPFILRDLGRMPYGEVFDLQKELQQDVIGWRSEDDADDRPLGYMLLVEHDPPVITVSRRKGARQHLVATPEMLANAGVEVAETDRGGDITYHGPGQLVAYPILDLNRLGLRLHGYMRFLEDVVIETLAAFGIEGHRDPDATGVWVGERHQGIKASRHRGGSDGSAPGASKICAMGVRISRWVSMHGLALNVTTNLDHFNLIVPCGLAGRGVTNMSQELAAACPGMGDVKKAMIEVFAARSIQCVEDRAAAHAESVTR